MAGNQFGCIFSDLHDFDQVHTTALERLKYYFKDYKLEDEDIVSINFVIR